MSEETIALESGPKEIIFQEKKGTEARCLTCYRKCLFNSETFHGFCRTRQYKKKENTLYSLVYGRSVSFQVDPIEKKPFYHFMPGTFCLGIATLGCSFACKFCQNWQIAAANPLEHEVPFTLPSRVVEMALEDNTDGIAYTYTEPTVFLEYAYDVMKLAKPKGLYNVWVSNGYMTRQVMDLVKGYLDAINIDLKGGAGFYKEIVGGADVEKVRENIRYVYEKMPDTHLEVTCLIIPGYNDSKKVLGRNIEFIASVGKDIPVHFSRFYPAYKMLKTPPTLVEALKKAKEMALEKGLKHVHIGNVPYEGYFA